MSLYQFTESLAEQGVELWVEEKNLRYRAPREVFTPTLVKDLKKRKTDLIGFLNNENYVQATYPLSFPQKSLWYIYHSDPGSPAYNTAMPIRCLFKVDPRVLRYALRTMLEKHPALRCTFTMRNGEPVQQQHRTPEIVLEMVDAASLAEKELKRQVTQAHRRPFDLETGPLVRATLFSRGTNDHVLLISIHHIVCDGWSMWSFINEFWQTYAGIKSGHCPFVDRNGVHFLHSYDRALPEIDLQDFQADPAQPDDNFVTGYLAMEAIIPFGVADAFRTMGGFSGPGETYDMFRLRKTLGVIPRYFSLFEALVDILARSGLVGKEDDRITTAPGPGSGDAARKPDRIEDAMDELLLDSPGVAPYVTLLRQCLSALPQVLRGEKSYLDVLFTKSSLRLVENVYKGNAAIDHSNRIVGDVVASYIRKRIRLDPDARIRIAEIGAGTGSTTGFVLEAVKEWGPNLTYVYTDISSRFTEHGRETLGERYPFLQFKVLDLEKEIQGQGFDPDAYDIVIAANVIHATRNIEDTLYRIKQLQKANGILVINEITELLDFATLTFGLSDGWWLFEDRKNRIKGSPLVSAGKWEQILGDVGYTGIRTFGLPREMKKIAAHRVIIGTSDGAVRFTRGADLGDAGKAGTEARGPGKSYREFIAWQSEMTSGPVGERQWQYWKNKLAGELAPLNLQGDRPRLPIQSHNGDWIPFELSPNLAAGLRKLARDKELTLYAILLSGYQMLLHRYTGQADILVGCPTTGRTQSDFSGTIGHFVNTIVLRADFSDDPTLGTFLETNRRNLLEAFEHQDYPFFKLVDRLRPPRDPGRTPVFQTMFVFQKPHYTSEFSSGFTEFYTGRGRIEFENLAFESFPMSQQEGQFDLSVEVLESVDAINGVFKYNTDLFDRETIARMMDSYIRVLEQILSHPGQSVSRMGLLTLDETDQLITRWNDTAQDRQGRTAIHRLFERQAAKTPDSPALAFGDRGLSYKQLNTRANQLAHYLRRKGVRPDSRVGICIERSFEMIIGVLGILKAGGGYVPFDPQYPEERLDYMITNAEIEILLIHDATASVFDTQDTAIVNLETDWKEISRRSRNNPSCKVSPEHLGYILYTSGSTGRPKGVAMNQGPLCNLIEWQKKNFSAPADARTLQFTTLNFDVSFQEIFSTLCSGGELVLINESLRQDPPALLDFMAQASIRRLYAPFVFLQMLADMAVADGDTPGPGLTEIITAGEQLRVTRPLRSFIENLDGCTLHNQYGPTESHVVTAYTLGGEPGEWPLLPSIGKPIDNARIYILDSHMNPVPVGVAGELYIGGPCLAREYYSRPDLTAEKFIPDPFSPDGSGRLYKTGDLARYLSDGNIAFLGRADNQVKIRGFRVEPAEIEESLLAHDAIDEAVVADRSEPDGDKYLCAYIVSGKAFTVPELKSYLARKLPDFMIPPYFVRLDRIPLTPNNKVDRLALPEPDRKIDTGTEFVAPRNEVEENLVAIWEEALHIKNLSIEDDLFDLGGNSQKTLTIYKAIDRLYPGRIAIPHIIKYPRISLLAREIQNRQAGTPQKSERNAQMMKFLSVLNKTE